jgi:hypothetical protein
MFSVSRKKMAASARGNGIEDKREIGEIFRGYRNSQDVI